MPARRNGAGADGPGERNALRGGKFQPEGLHLTCFAPMRKTDGNREIRSRRDSAVQVGDVPAETSAGRISSPKLAAAACREARQGCVDKGCVGQGRGISR